MIVAVSGGTGFIGARLVKSLLEAGNDVRILTRHPKPAGERVSYHHWDAAAGQPSAEALEGANAVVHLAGEPVMQRWTDEVKRRIRDTRVASTRHLVQALSTMSMRPLVLVNASAIGYYGNRGDEVMTESSMPGKGLMADLCVDWEREALLAEALGMRTVRVRNGLVLGQAGGALKPMLPPFRFGLGARLGSGKQWMSWIHVDDLVSILLHAIESSKASGAWNGVSPNAVTNAEFTATLARVLRRPALLAVPKFALKLRYGAAAEFLFDSARVVPRQPLEAGYRFKHPVLEEALRSILRPS